MTQHLNELCSLVNNNKTSDSFAKHFATHHRDRSTKLTAGEARRQVKVSIVWQGKPISCNKSFSKLNCSLCMKERLEILKLSREDPAIIIIDSSEFYGACRHKPRFHRYTTNCTDISSTGDGRTGSERVNTSDSENSQNSLGTIGATVSHENNKFLCRPCTTVEPLRTSDLNVSAVNQESSFADV